VSGGATVDDADLTSLDGIDVSVDQSGELAVKDWTSFTDGSFTAYGGAYTLSNATDVVGSNLDAENGATLSLPAVIAVSGNEDFSVTWQANGTDSQLLLHNLRPTGLGPWSTCRRWRVSTSTSRSTP
jgi:hypothetical protein